MAMRQRANQAAEAGAACDGVMMGTFELRRSLAATLCSGTGNRYNEGSPIAESSHDVSDRN
jgi:hypothetical protein